MGCLRRRQRCKSEDSGNKKHLPLFCPHNAPSQVMHPQSEPSSLSLLPHPYVFLSLSLFAITKRPSSLTPKAFPCPFVYCAIQKKFFCLFSCPQKCFVLFFYNPVPNIISFFFSSLPYICFLAWRDCSFSP